MDSKGSTYKSSDLVELHLVPDLNDVHHYGNLCSGQTPGKDLVGTNVISTKVTNYQKLFDAGADKSRDLAEERLCQDRLPSFSLVDPVEGPTESALKTRLDGIAKMDAGDPTHKRADLGCQPSDPNEGELTQIFVKSMIGQSGRGLGSRNDYKFCSRRFINRQIFQNVFQSLLYAGKSHLLMRKSLTTPRGTAI